MYSIYRQLHYFSSGQGRVCCLKKHDVCILMCSISKIYRFHQDCFGLFSKDLSFCTQGSTAHQHMNESNSRFAVFHFQPILHPMLTWMLCHSEHLACHHIFVLAYTAGTGVQSIYNKGFWRIYNLVHHVLLSCRWNSENSLPAASCTQHHQGVAQIKTQQTLNLSPQPGYWISPKHRKTSPIKNQRSNWNLHCAWPSSC